MKLSISKKKFLELYDGLLSYAPFDLIPASREEFINKQLVSKIWRLNNLYTIVDKNGERIKFRMNWAQHVVYSYYLRHPRLLILKSRQQGISTFWLIFYFDDAVFGADRNIGLMAQGKSESSTLLKRVKLAWDMLDDSIKLFLSIGLGKNNTEEFSFDNGSTIFIRTSFRSATLQGLHISEYGKIANKYPERARETKTGTMQAIKAGLPIAIESTAEGDNDFKKMWYNAEDRVAEGKAMSGKDFMPVFLPWYNDPDCVSTVKEEPNITQEKYFQEYEDDLGVKLTVKQKNFWIVQYRELGDDIYQEYPRDPTEAFMATKDGTYYAKAYREWITRRNREVSGLYDENLPVDVMLDLGMNDTMVLAFFQIYYGRAKPELRIIDEYYNVGEGLEHYVRVLEEKDYKLKGTVILPHDVKVRELSTGKSRLHRLRELGVRDYKVLPRIAINDGIEAVRRTIPHMYVDVRCTYLIDCLKNYSKEWDDKFSNWKDKPKHDEWSHGADTVRGICVGAMPIGAQGKQTGDLQKKVHATVVDGLAL